MGYFTAGVSLFSLLTITSGAVFMSTRLRCFSKVDDSHHDCKRTGDITLAFGDDVFSECCRHDHCVRHLVTTPLRSVRRCVTKQRRRSQAATKTSGPCLRFPLLGKPSIFVTFMRHRPICHATRLVCAKTHITSRSTRGQ